MWKAFVAVICICVISACAVSPARAAESKGNAKAPAGQDPGPKVLEGCKKLDVVPAAYMTERFIIQAPPERINKAVAWVREIETKVYPTMIDMLGYRPDPELYAVIFKDDSPKDNPAVYTGVGPFEKTEYRAHRIHVRCEKLDRMPPWQVPGGVTHETIHALLNEPTVKQADWKPIWESHLMPLVFEMDLFKRLGMKDEVDTRWRDFVEKNPKSRYAALGHFWKQHGWTPFQKLLVKLHEHPDYKPTMDEATFVYEISLGAGKDASGFFEQRGWKVPAEMKARIQRELKAAQDAGKKEH